MPRTRKWTDIQILRLERDFESQIPINELALKYNRSVYSVLNALYKNGIAKYHIENNVVTVTRILLHPCYEEFWHQEIFSLPEKVTNYSTKTSILLPETKIENYNDYLTKTKNDNYQFEKLQNDTDYGENLDIIMNISPKNHINDSGRYSRFPLGIMRHNVMGKRLFPSFENEPNKKQKINNDIEQSPEKNPNPVESLVKPSEPLQIPDAPSKKVWYKLW